MEQEHELDVPALKRLINSTPELISILYDVDLLPEQVREGSREWGLMLVIAFAYQLGRDSKDPRPPAGLSDT